jgi:predicted transcriptional regulator of viral defense system
MTDRDVPDAVRKRQVMTVEQWRSRGVSRPLLRALTRSGELVPLRRGVYVTKSALLWAGSDGVRRHVLHVLAAQSVVGRHAVASYHSAAVLHRIDLLETPPEGIVALTLPPATTWNRARPASIVFHAAELPGEHVARLYSLPVTTAARTIADLARTLPFTDAVVAADSALRKEQVTKPELHKVLAGCGRWPGVRQARRVVEFADERAESPLESAARVVFDRFGLDPPELQATVLTPGNAFRVDFLWREHKLVVEADGLVKYSSRRDVVRQLDRDRLLRDAGYKVAHFTWAELFGTPEAVVGRIRWASAAIAPY